MSVVIIYISTRRTSDMGIGEFKSTHIPVVDLPEK